MNENIFYILDVFAEEKYAGNQLGVFRNVQGLSDDDKQTIAKEMNYSETTFIISEQEREGGYDVRIFTPAEEVPFAGHPTLGTAYVIQRYILQKPVPKVCLNLKAGQIPVTFKYAGEEADELWMEQNQPNFGDVIDVDLISRILCLDKASIDTLSPVQEVSTGLPFIVVPLKNLEAVKKARIDRSLLFEFIKDRKAKAILVFAPETYFSHNDLNVRVFVDYYGIPEDPATGSANGCLAGYLVKHGYFGRDEINIRVEQGYEIGRKSMLLLKAIKKGEIYNIFVGGKVIPVSEGRFI